MTEPVPIYTDALVEKVRETIAAYRRAHGQGIDARRLATALFNNGVALVDRDRKGALVDERVYAGALARCHAAERRAPVHRMPPAAVWITLSEAS